VGRRGRHGQLGGGAPSVAADRDLGRRLRGGAAHQPGRRLRADQARDGPDAPARRRSVIHIGSALGTAAAPFFSPYVASKGGLAALARAAAVELVQDGIRVNVVAPGTIDTVINAGVSDFRRNMLQHRIPIGRAGHVDDVAAACLYLASDAARYVTGSTLAVDGGWTAS